MAERPWSPLSGVGPLLPVGTHVESDAIGGQADGQSSMVSCWGSSSRACGVGGHVLVTRSRTDIHHRVPQAIVAGTESSAEASSSRSPKIRCSS